MGKGYELGIHRRRNQNCHLSERMLNLTNSEENANERYNGKPFVPIIKIPVIENCVKCKGLKRMTITNDSGPMEKRHFNHYL